MRKLDISESIITNINNVSLDISGTVIPSLIDFSTISDESNVRAARKGMLDILLGNDPSCVSFMTTKTDLGILLDNTDDIPDLRANKNFDLSFVQVFSPGPDVVVDLNNIVENNTSVYGALTQTGDAIKFTKYGNELLFIRQADGTLSFTDSREITILEQGVGIASTMGTIIYTDGLFTEGEQEPEPEPEPEPVSYTHLRAHET